MKAANNANFLILLMIIKEKLDRQKEHLFGSNTDEQAKE